MQNFDLFKKVFFGNISSNTAVVAAMACVPLMGAAGASRGLYS